MKLLECVPNFSEGCDMRIIASIASSVESMGDVKVIGIDPGKDANRTVMTFIGDPSAVTDAAFRATETASRLIDMRHHHGVHPRFGATDVLPLIPYRGMTMEEAAGHARSLGKRIGEELGIPVYFYEYAATVESRRNLSECRKGGYEGLPVKLSNPAWKPDYGPHIFSDRVAVTGATAVGARKVLIAFNVNLNTSSVQIAREIASEIRESGINDHNSLSSDPGGRTERKKNMPHGNLPRVKAIGWYIPEYGKAQVSMNLTDADVTPLHVAFEEVCRIAHSKGVRVTGSEIVGMIPLKNIADAGRQFLRKEGTTADIPEPEIVSAAVEYLGLRDVAPFDPEEKIIEYRAPQFFS